MNWWLGPPVVPLYPFLGEIRFPYSNRLEKEKVGTLILSNLEDLGGRAGPSSSTTQQTGEPGAFSAPPPPLPPAQNPASAPLAVKHSGYGSKWNHQESDRRSTGTTGVGGRDFGQPHPVKQTDLLTKRFSHVGQCRIKVPKGCCFWPGPIGQVRREVRRVSLQRGSPGSCNACQCSLLSLCPTERHTVGTGTIAHGEESRLPVSRSLSKHG